jgi:hypothetical protein
LYVALKPAREENLPGITPVWAENYGIVPDGRRFAIVVLTNSSKTPLPDRDRAIAEIARSLLDYFYVGRMAKQ